MSQQSRKRQHLEEKQEQGKEDKGNGNELREHVKTAALEAKNGVFDKSLGTVKEENEALGKKLKEAEEKAQMAKNEQQKNPEKLEALLLKEQQKKEEEETTISSSSSLELNLELEITQNSPDLHRVPLPLELNCQIFECLKFGIQRKLIGGLGRGIYGMFRQKVLTKSKRVWNPEQNGWEASNTGAVISSNGLSASDNTGSWQNVFAKKGFPITGELSRTDNFPGTILYYFEVTQMCPATQIWSNSGLKVGFSDGNNSNVFFLGFTPNSYGFSCDGLYYYFTRKKYAFGRSIELKLEDPANVCGCGILLNPQNKLSIFFTLNGTLLDKPIPISPSVDCLYLYPTITMTDGSMEANFGTDPAKPFEYNIEKCPGMGDDD